MMRYVLAHRGVSSKGENSLESIIEIKSYCNSKDIKYGIEFDIQRTDYGSIICYHDDNLLRLHKIDKKVSSLTDEDIIEHKIPYLKDILNEFINTDYILNIELKSYNMTNYSKQKMCIDINSLIVESGLNGNCIVSSFDIEIIKYMLTNYPKIESVLIIYDELVEETLNDMIDIGMTGIVINKEQFMNIDKFISKGLKVLVYTFFDNDNNDNNDNNNVCDKDILYYLSKYDNIYYVTDDIDKTV